MVFYTPVHVQFIYLHSFVGGISPFWQQGIGAKYNKSNHSLKTHFVGQQTMQFPKCELTHWVSWKIFGPNFCAKIFMLKYFSRLWHPTKIKYAKCLLYTNIHAFNSCGSPAAWKYYNNKQFPNYNNFKFFFNFQLVCGMSPVQQCHVCFFRKT